MSGPEPSDDPPRFSTGHVGPSSSWLLPICCLMAGSHLWTTMCSAGWRRTYCSSLLPGTWDSVEHPTGRSCQSCPCGLGTRGPRRGLRFGRRPVADTSAAPVLRNRDRPAGHGEAGRSHSELVFFLPRHPRSATWPTSGLDASPLGHIVCQPGGPRLGRPEISYRDSVTRRTRSSAGPRWCRPPAAGHRPEAPAHPLHRSPATPG